ncbi:MazG nucleotide pyrophosphohydrolase domain-containing protein [Nesterenkonia alba]|uniref:MazG nucleotide pyrophosphohydrolase domain-containing protein n=1 Tax=Nesterenkonia alba TaxID=515814 RepID=UPI0003B5ECDA|nr:MazG nucleotide pyrophosphohydrolase domain-containing protein [Nesterenkonia alba]
MAENNLANMQRLQQIIAELRQHCPWTAQLTHESLTEYLTEEAQEVAEEISAGVTGEPLRQELGDVLLQVVLHAQLASERGEFDLDGVAEAISAKLIRRNPHVYAPDGTLDPKAASIPEIEAAWQRVKAEEKNTGA